MLAASILRAGVEGACTGATGWIAAVHCPQVGQVIAAIHTYVAKAKVKMFQARHWIASEGMRVAVAADRLGYDSEAAFSRAFKRVMGLAPSAVRG